MSRIITIKGREIIDSRGNPTVEADVITDEGDFGRAAVPSGASTGTLEAVELRDGDKHRFRGKGVTQAVAAINTEICKALNGLDVGQQGELDEALIALDGTPNKSRLGANALLATSLAAAKAAAQERGIPLYKSLAAGDSSKLCIPTPMINILNGGSHANNSMDVQEFMIIPAGLNNITEAIQAGSEIFQSLAEILKQSGNMTTVGDEGGFAPNLESNEAGIELVLEAIANAGYTAGKDIYIALDVASSEIYHEGCYHFTSENRTLSATELVDSYEKWVDQYPLVSIEDGLCENDWAGWKMMTERLGDRVQLVGDDLFVTNTKLLEKGIEMGVANSILIKLNQIGTLSETLDAMKKAQSVGYSSIISHRSGETEDTTIADLAVATGAGQIKTGSMSRSDRVAKYNQLLRIDEELGAQAKYAGRNPLQRFLRH